MKTIKVRGYTKTSGDTLFKVKKITFLKFPLKGAPKATVEIGVIKSKKPMQSLEKVAKEFAKIIKKAWANVKIVRAKVVVKGRKIYVTHPDFETQYIIEKRLKYNPKTMSLIGKVYSLSDVWSDYEVIRNKDEQVVDTYPPYQLDYLAADPRLTGKQKRYVEYLLEKKILSRAPVYAILR